MIHFPTHKNNALKIPHFNTSRIIDIKIQTLKLSILTLNLLGLLKSRERWKISRVNNPKTESVCT